MTFVSLFAGIGGFDVALEREGHECVGQCEIDPHARSVLDRHWPYTPKHADVTTLTSDHFKAPDLVTFGSPCQDLSIAGRRAGLNGARSGLFMEAISYMREVRKATNGQSPTFAIWENVPGAFSSNGGRDFAVVLRALAELGALDISWRVLDSQWFGVPQRRRRIFLVADFGGHRAAEILSLPESLSWDSPTRQETREEPTGSTTGRPASAWGLSGEFNAGFDLMPTLQHDSPSGGGQKPMVATPVAHTSTMPTLRAGAAIDGPGKDVRSGDTKDEYIVPVAFDWTASASRSLNPAPVAPAMEAQGKTAISTLHSVRRLTPRECERLQGFPDDHTRYDHNGTEIADTHRYRMLGNAVTVNVAQHLGERLAAVA